MSLRITTDSRVRSQQAIREVITAYSDPIARAYCWGRFLILRQRFLSEIGQYLPRHGAVLDIGCGFGLFSLFYAQTIPDLRIYGVDLNSKRIAMASAAAERLGLANVRYAVENATALTLPQNFNAAYMLDIIHHIPRAAVRPLLAQIYTRLSPGGRLIIKDVHTRPMLKRWFTHALDKAMDPTAQVNYWERNELLALLESIGFEVFTHAMEDILPYPHQLYVCKRV
jgi:ubiquinone/menaquinone biosynthesis C-methylase UbiE